MWLRPSAAMKSSQVVTRSMQLSNSARALAYMSACGSQVGKRNGRLGKRSWNTGETQLADWGNESAFEESGAIPATQPPNAAGLLPPPRQCSCVMHQTRQTATACNTRSPSFHPTCICSSSCGTAAASSPHAQLCLPPLSRRASMATPPSMSRGPSSRRSGTPCEGMKAQRCRSGTRRAAGNSPPCHRGASSRRSAPPPYEAMVRGRVRPGVCCAAHCATTRKPHHEHSMHIVQMVPSPAAPRSCTSSRGCSCLAGQPSRARLQVE